MLLGLQVRTFGGARKAGPSGIVIIMVSGSSGASGEPMVCCGGAVSGPWKCVPPVWQSTYLGTMPRRCVAAAVTAAVQRRAEIHEVLRWPGVTALLGPVDLLLVLREHAGVHRHRAADEAPGPAWVGAAHT